MISKPMKGFEDKYEITDSGEILNIKTNKYICKFIDATGMISSIIIKGVLKRLYTYTPTTINAISKQVLIDNTIFFFILIFLSFQYTLLH